MRALVLCLLLTSSAYARPPVNIPKANMWMTPCGITPQSLPFDRKDDA